MGAKIYSKSQSKTSSFETNESKNMPLIRFKINEFSNLRNNLLEDSSKEAFAILLAKREVIGNSEIYTVRDIRYPLRSEYINQSLTFLRMSEQFIIKTIKELQERFDVDTIIDVHTHPFSERLASFSGVDDRDEINFYKWVDENFDFNYGSIVLSQTEYSARFWKNIADRSNNKFKNRTEIKSVVAEIKTQTESEKIFSSDLKNKKEDDFNSEMFNRGVLALGLDNMRKIAGNSSISIIGAGGTGSVVAESLVHMGFQKINLIDHDHLEVSNMNRIVGAYYNDAVSKKPKVEIVGRHLKNINPKLQLTTFQKDVHDKSVEEAIAKSDWLIMATDNHSSRFKTQELAFKYFVPFISLGVNITVKDKNIEDESGEVITIRIGDKVCLNCLKRLNHINIAHERNSAGENISKELEKKGYVEGKNVKEPAVKTLNSILGQLAVNSLVNQYTNRNKNQTITVFENNIVPTIYEDRDSVINRNLVCATCGI